VSEEANIRRAGDCRIAAGVQEPPESWLHDGPGSCIDPIGGCANAHASAVSTDAGVRIDPEG
jgi:hypothetical protein